MGAARKGETIDEDQPFTVGRLGIAYINSKHEAELVSMRAAAKGLPVVIVNPSFVLGPDDPNPSGTSNALVRRLLLRRIPGYLDGAINIVDVRDVAKGHVLADERGEDGERYLLTGRNFTQQRLFADLSRIAGVPPPPLRMQGRLALTGVEAMELAGLRLPTSADEVRSGTQWFTYRNDKARRAARLGAAAARGDVRGHRPVAARAARQAGGGPSSHRPGAPLHRRGPPPGSLRLMSEPRRVLYRCGTPTNFLCPCGAVARRLKKLGLDHRTERVPRRRSRRPEIVELTKQPYVPVLVDGEEVVSDSRRILQYLDWKYGEEAD